MLQTLRGLYAFTVIKMVSSVLITSIYKSNQGDDLWPARYYRVCYPGDIRSWESPQTLPALFIGSFEHVERFRNLKFAVTRITNIQSTVLSSFEGTAAIHLAFK